MKFLEAEDDNQNNLYQRLVSEDGKIEMGIFPVMFGYRIRAGFVGNGMYDLDWCGGDDQKQLELLYSIMKNILEARGNFRYIPPSSIIKPFFNDHDFVNRINELVSKPLQVVVLKPLHLDRQKLMASL